MLINPTRSYSAKDLPANTKIKYRQVPEVPVAEFKEPLLGKRRPEQSVEDVEENLKVVVIDVQNPFTQDEDIDFEQVDQDSVPALSQNDESDDDLELLREYEKLKKERELEKQMQEQAKMRELEAQQKQEYLSGNPLLNA